MWRGRKDVRNICTIVATAGLLASIPQADAQDAAPKPLAVTLAVRQVFATSGYPSNVLTKGDNVIVSVSPFATGEKAGLEIFGLVSSSGQFAPSCGDVLTFPPDDKVVSAMGTKFLDKRRTRIGIAVECAGAEIAYMGNPASCAFQATPVRIPQPSVENCQGQDPPGTFDLAVSPNSQFAFLANEYGTLAGKPPEPGAGGTVGVIRLQTPGDPGYSVYIPGGATIAGVTMSKDGKRLYVTAEVSTTERLCGLSLSEPCNNPTNLPKLLGSELLKEEGCYQKDLTGPGKPNGLLTVFDVQKLKQGKGQNAIIGSIAAGCSPVRVVESKDAKTIWVAARGDNTVLSFDVAKLTSKNVNTVNASFLGSASSGGTAPVGMALFSRGRLLAVVNSNRFNRPTGTSSLAIFDARDKLLRKVAELDIPPMSEVPVTTNHPDISSPVEGYLSSFPRNVEVGADGETLYVTKFVGGEVMVVSTSVTQGP